MQNLLEHHLCHAGPVRQRDKAGGRAADQRQRTCLYAAQKHAGRGMSVRQLGMAPWKPVGPQCADPTESYRPDPIQL
jgi:hypothetical protein